MAEAEFPLAAVLGPTGSGKSELALRIAEEFSGEVVNCDSLQLYRFLDVGTAKLTPEERRGIPHHLLDVLDPDQVFTAGAYARMARPAIAAIAGRGKLPILAGGTGFYVRALLEGLFPGPQRDERLRARLARRESRRCGWLHSTLARFDPPSAARIHPSDTQKLVRAVEILFLTRRPLTEWFAEGRDALGWRRVLKLGLDPPRPALYERIDARCSRMFDAGLIEEVRRVLEMGYPLESKALEAHGYRQAVAVIRGELGRDDAVQSAQRNTRRYAKRQWTWFRRDPEIKWLRGFGDNPDLQKAAFELVRAFVGGPSHFR